MLGNYNDICTTVKWVKDKYGFRKNPFKLCDDLGYVLNPVSFGRDENAIKAFILQSNRIKCITYNCDLSDDVLKPIIFHEIGHGLLHQIGLHGFTEITLYDESSEKEKEANLFCAEYMLEDREVLDVLNSDTTFFTAASVLGVPPEILDFKFRLLKWKGYKLNEPPIYSSSNFMRNMDISASDIFCE